MEPFKKTSLKERLERLSGTLPARAWKLTDHEKKKGQEFLFYRAGKNLGFLISFINSRSHYEKEKHGVPIIRKSHKKVHHITWYRPDLRTTISICWFSGSGNRSFRGIKVFWPYPSSAAEKKHFEIPCKVHDPETDLPAKVQIEILVREAAAWILDPKSFEGYPKYTVETR
tara:strand:+ start:1497 stop:2009 length:513 start_codon:yes stop_codon:yes gene_type:complete